MSNAEYPNDADEIDDVDEFDNSDDPNDSLMTTWASSPDCKRWSWP